MRVVMKDRDFEVEDRDRHKDNKDAGTLYLPSSDLVASSPDSVGL